MASPLVKRYLVALKKFYWILPFGPMLGAGVGAFLAVQPTPDPSFRAQGTLSYRQQPVSFSETGAAIQEQGQLLTKEMLVSEDVIASVAAGIRVDLEEVVDKTKVNIVEPEAEGGPRAIEVIYQDDNPKRAQTAVGTLMELMVEKSRQLNTARLRSIINTVEKRLPDATAELRQAEQALERYDREEGAAILAAQNGNLVGAIAGSREQQRQLRLQIEGVAAQIRSLEQRLGLSADEAYVASALSSDPLIGELRAQLYQIETQRSLNAQTLRDEHPIMKNLTEQQRTYESLLESRAAEVIGGGPLRPLVGSSERIREGSTLDPARQQLANSLVALQTQQETLTQQLATTIRMEQELRAEYESIPNKELERQRLAQQVVLKKAIYDRMQSKLVDSEAAEAETVSSLAIARPPTIVDRITPEGPPGLKLLLGAGGAGGLVLSAAIIFVLGMLEKRYQAMQEIRNALVEREVAVLGLLPELWLPEHVEDFEQLPVAPERSAASDAYERFRSNLRRLNPNLKVLLVISASRAEGKSTVAMNMAVAAARAGKRTLLLELDLRSPSHAKALKVAVDPAAYQEPLYYYRNLSDCVRLVPEVENLYMVPSPGPQINAASLLESSELRALLEDARRRFDFIAVDATALDRCNDALLLEPKTDGMILVARPAYTVSSTFTQTVDNMMDEDSPLSNVRLLGAAINDIPVAEVAVDTALLQAEDEDQDSEAIALNHPEALDGKALDPNLEEFAEREFADEFADDEFADDELADDEFADDEFAEEDDEFADDEFVEEDDDFADEDQDGVDADMARSPQRKRLFSLLRR
jgi:capsular exopolysaccharide synthesis family protein